jgi:V8-like Glu-specific endopeptidase
MLTTGLVLTAGHCVYSNYPDGDVGDKTGFVGYYDASTYYVIPGNTEANGVTTAPYGVWRVKNMWTTSDYASGLLGGDWGIIELSPNSNGQYPGQVGIGSFSATWNQPTIDQLYSIGYPTSGYFSASTANGLGNFQYFWDDTWDPSTDGETDAANYGAYYGLVVQPCEETGGASGGPVFTDVNGGWTIVGVNNRGPQPNAQGVSAYMMSFYLNSTFGNFWNYVVQQVNAGE